MFGNNSKKQDDGISMSTSSSSAPSGAINSLVQGTLVEGSISTNNDIRIDGSLKGTLNCKGKVIVGPDGDIDGEVNCENAVVQGKFNGELKVNQVLDVRETARITGNVMTAKLIVESGATFDVTCQMGTQKIKTLGKSAEA